MKFSTLRKAFPFTLPVLGGYLALGFGFGILLTTIGYGWFISFLMSFFMFAGAGQYLAVSFFAANLSITSMLLVTFLVNSRHIFYGLSLFEKTKTMNKWEKFNLIFSLTDENYALLSSLSVPAGVDPAKFYTALVSLNHLYWILGSLLGSLIGSYLNFNPQGIEFALVALFVVIVLDQWAICTNKLPFYLGGISAILALLFAKPYMMPVAGLLTTVALLFVRKVESKYDNK
ncbi:MAG: AzlC family ABC transporter permease [Clostridia bacterium]